MGSPGRSSISWIRKSSRPAAEVFTVVGSGFGLYGYLPAVADTFRSPVLLPERYRAKVEARPELRPYRDLIRWTPDTELALAQATGVVIATPPHRQVEVAERSLELPGIQVLVLEKPLAPTPSASHALLDAVRRSLRRYRVGYTFLYTDWAQDLSWPSADAVREVTMTWTFMAHHFANNLHNWKRAHAEGGGPLRFFGVHLLALLARQGYRDVVESTLEGVVAGEPERWRAVFSGDGLPKCRVLVDSRSDAMVFRIDAGQTVVDIGYPYAGGRAEGEADRRVGVLKRFLATLQEPDEPFESFYRAVGELWDAVERTTRISR